MSSTDCVPIFRSRKPWKPSGTNDHCRSKVLLYKFNVDRVFWCFSVTLSHRKRILIRVHSGKIWRGEMPIVVNGAPLNETKSRKECTEGRKYIGWLFYVLRRVRVWVCLLWDDTKNVCLHVCLVLWEDFAKMKPSRFVLFPHKKVPYKESAHKHLSFMCILRVVWS